MACQNMFDPYKILHVKPACTMKEIKSSYRKLSMKFHPDKNPDNEVCKRMFQDIAKAYSFIGSQENREKFDAGEDMEANNPLTAALNILVPIFVQFCLQGFNNPVLALQNHLDENKGKCKQAIEKVNGDIKTLKKCCDKISGDEKNILKGGLLAKIDDMKAGNKQNKETLGKLKLAIDFCKDFEYLAEEQNYNPLLGGDGARITWMNV